MKVFRNCLFSISSVFFTMTCFSVFAHPCSRGNESYHCDYSILEGIVCEENFSSSEEMKCALSDIICDILSSKHFTAKRNLLGP